MPDSKPKPAKSLKDSDIATYARRPGPAAGAPGTDSDAHSDSDAQTDHDQAVTTDHDTDS